MSCSYYCVLTFKVVIACNAVVSKSGLGQDTLPVMMPRKLAAVFAMAVYVTSARTTATSPPDASADTHYPAEEPAERAYAMDRCGPTHLSHIVLIP